MDQSYLLLSDFIQELSHALRTPLSVIANDLEYLSSVAGEQETKRALGRCRQIAEVLTTLTPPAVAHTKASAVPISQIAVDLAAAGLNTPVWDANSVAILGHREVLQWIWTSLGTLLDQLKISVLETVLTLENNSFRINLISTFPTSENGLPLPECTSFTKLTKLCSNSRLPLAMLLDAALDLSHATVALETMQSPVIRICLPLST